MEVFPDSPHVAHFDVFEVDLRSGELRQPGSTIRLQDQPLRILTLLLEHPGEVVTREELEKRLWTDGVVVDFEHSINSAVKRLRNALGDDAEHPRYIETLPRRGYRFIGQVKFFGGLHTAAARHDSVPAEPALRLVPKLPPSEPGPAGTRTMAALLPPSERRAFALPRWVAIALAAVALIAAGGWALRYHYFRPVPETSSPPMKVVPLTSFLGSEEDPTFSPDGKQIAFAWDRGNKGKYDIYVKMIGTEGLLRLTTNPAVDRAPAWSPDGRHIAFHRHSEKEDGIYLVPAIGGPEQKLYEARLPGPWNIERPGWSPDGKFLAFSEATPDRKFFRISVLSVETLEKRIMTTPPSSAIYGDRWPRYSPDGRTIAFVRGFSGATKDLFLIPAEGGEPRQLTHGADVLGLTWTPDSARLIYSASQAGAQGLWEISVASGNTERLTVGTQNAVQPVLSRDGRRLAYTQLLENDNIWRFEAPQQPGPTRLPTRLIASTQYDGSEQYSPDGRKIVFVSGRSGTLEIWASDSDGTNPVRLTHFGGPRTGTPRWSPDGRQIAFDCDAGGNGDIYVVSAEGGKPHRLSTESSNEFAPSWSRDGRWIYFSSSRTGAWQLWKMPAVGGKAVQVTKGGGFGAFESYDGKTLYYAKGLSAPGLWKMPVAGGEESLVLEQLGVGSWGYWGLTRQGIYFYNAATKAIEFYSFSTRKVTRVAKPDIDPAEGSPGFSVSPDGRWMLYTQVDSFSSNIMLVENFQ